MPSAQESDSNASRSDPSLKLLAGMAIGATLAYLFDPDRGAARRARLRDQGAAFLRSAKWDAQAAAQDVRNRAKGAIAESRAASDDESIGPDQLVARVRSALGHHVDRVRPIEVTAENGRVILRASADAGDIDRVIETVRSVRGVSEVDNRLEAAREDGSDAR
jgi:osmotically-inducible protein OsmY